MTIRTLFAALFLLCGLSMSVAAPAQTPRDWRTVATRGVDGVYTIGNPQAAATLTEYLSYTCPHCGAFVAESKPALTDDLVRSGKVRVRVMNAVRDPLDLAATLLTRCAGPAKFVAAHDAVFASQSALLGKASAIPPAQVAAAATMPLRLRLYARASGLTALMQAQGMPAAAIVACLSDQATIKRSVDGAGVIWKKISGTPSFEVNGAMVDGHDWADIEPALRAAVK